MARKNKSARSQAAAAEAPVLAAPEMITEEAASPMPSPLAALSRVSSPPASPLAAALVEGAPKAEDSPVAAAGSKTGSRRPSFMAFLERRDGGENLEATAEVRRQSRRNSFVDKAKSLFGKSKATAGAEVVAAESNELALDGADAVETQQKETVADTPKAESRTDRWKRRLSLSRDRSVERSEKTPRNLVAESEPASPQNASPASRMDRWRRRLSLSKKDGEERLPSRAEESDDAQPEEKEVAMPAEEVAAPVEEKESMAVEKKEEIVNAPVLTVTEAFTITIEGEPGAETKNSAQASVTNESEASPTHARSESRANRWRRRLSLSRDRSVEKNDAAEVAPKSPSAGAGEDSLGRRIFRRLSLSSRDGKDTESDEMEGEEKEGRMSRLRRRLSISKKASKTEEQTETSEVEKESGRRRMLRRLSISSRKSVHDEEESEASPTHEASKWKRRLSLSSRTSRVSREGSVCSNTGEEATEGRWRRRLSLRSRSREPPLPSPQAARTSLKDKLKGLVRRRDSRAEDMERVEKFHNPDYQPSGKIEVESSVDADSEKEDDICDLLQPDHQGAGDLTEGFAVSTDSSRVVSMQADTDLTPREAREEAAMPVETPKDFEDWIEGAVAAAEEQPLNARIPAPEKRLPGPGMMGLFCCGAESRETEEERERWREAVRYSCSKFRPREKVFMSQPVVCRELGDDEDFGPNLCYAPTEYALDIEKAF
ncbi:hypothetical protein BESB_080920 [Besnoitia besnoiti]|uniref:Uncharacterized protein n=1 Tax=Besnoitia besnoiti TaxID=94643 RepID=A0A2A9MD49_BESBE|nr:hypothetical protein BESB_080920 [Besnoitia besnoiti]PFH33876.1 hypothetical protein BESB_080920 [Besnoitia besnoiti]